MSGDEAPFFDPRDDIEQHIHHLPHWQQDDCTYFVSFNQADAIPKRLREQLDEERRIWLKFHPEPWSSDVELEYHRRFSSQIERWLDAGHGSCRLRDPVLAELLAATLRAFHLERYELHAWVIMPNHTHVLFSLRGGTKLERTMQSWKGVSARKIHCAVAEHDPHFWQEDYFDRLIRDSDHFLNVARYIRNNPFKAKLQDRGGYLLWLSERVGEVLDSVDR